MLAVYVAITFDNNRLGTVLDFAVVGVDRMKWIVLSQLWGCMSNWALLTESKGAAIYKFCTLFAPSIIIITLVHFYLRRYDGQMHVMWYWSLEMYFINSRVLLHAKA